MPTAEELNLKGGSILIQEIPGPDNSLRQRFFVFRGYRPPGPPMKEYPRTHVVVNEYISGVGEIEQTTDFPIDTNWSNRFIAYEGRQDVKAAQLVLQHLQR